MIGDRIKEERERIGLTQPAFAEAAGASKRTLIDWEKGVTSPTAVQLSALSGIGVDVQYVVTGMRGHPSPSIGYVSNLVLLMLQEMPEEKQREVLKYAEERKQLADCFEAESGGRKCVRRGAA